MRNQRNLVNPNEIKRVMNNSIRMTALTKLQEKAKSLIATDDDDLIQDKINKLKEKMGSESYSLAKVWKTTAIDPDTELGRRNRFDALALVHSSHSERDLAELFYEDLKEISSSTLVNKAVKVSIDDIPFTVVPTKFAQQGTIGVAEDGHLNFSDVVNKQENLELLHQASVLVQNWQFLTGLDEESEILLPYEIELTLTHIIQEYEPEDLEELLSLFFKFGEEKRFATQINIFDKHGNILLYHDFMVPNKQHLLEEVFAANRKYNSETRDLGLFGIN